MPGGQREENAVITLFERQGWVVERPADGGGEMLVEARVQGARRGALEHAVRDTEFLVRHAGLGAWVREAALVDPEVPTRVVYHVYRDESGADGVGRFSAALRVLTGQSADHRLVAVPVGTDRETVRQELARDDFAGHRFDSARHTLRLDWSSQEQPPPPDSVADTRRLLFGGLLALAPGPAALAATWLVPGSRLLWFVLVLVGTAPLTLRPEFTKRMGRTLCTGERHPPVDFIIVGTILTLGLTVAGAAATTVLAPVVWLMVALAAVVGTWFAVRDTVFTRHAAWILPLAVPALWPITAWLGGQVQAAYLKHFDIPADSVPVRSLSTYGAALPVLWSASLSLLITIGLLGWARHLHLIDRSTGPAIRSLVCLASALVVVWVVATGLDDAGWAAEDAKFDAFHYLTPAPYHGLQGTFVCVLAVERGKPIPVDNGPVPDVPVLSFGSSDDWVHLWSPRAYRSFAVRREDVQILSLDDDSKGCPPG